MGCCMSAQSSRSLQGGPHSASGNGGNRSANQPSGRPIRIPNGPAQQQQRREPPPSHNNTGLRITYL